MMNLQNITKHKAAAFCLVIIMGFMLTIGMRFFTRQVLVKRLGWRNAITEAILFDAPALKKLPSEENGANAEGKNIDWAQKYPFREHSDKDKNTFPFINLLEGLSSKVESAEKKINDYAGIHLLGQQAVVTAAKNIEDALALGIVRGCISGNIIFMNNGYLTYVEPKLSEAYIKENADSLVDFRDYLQQKNIPLLYINAGSKVNPLDKQLPDAAVARETTNERGDALIEALQQRNVACLDMRAEMHKADFDWYGAYYQNDHHWKAETGLWAAGIIADVLNHQYDYHFDLQKFNPANYTMETYEGIFLGGQGHEVTLSRARPEAYTCILPRFATDFTIEVPSRGVLLQGDYQHTLYDYDQFLACQSYKDNDFMTKPDAYHSVRWRNDPVGIIRNHQKTNNPGKKILVIQDSFGWYITTYLACDMPEINILHFTFNGSMRSYVEEYKPDLVLVIYCEKNIAPIDGASHTSQFDFR